MPASVQFMINAEGRRRLVEELGYKAEEVATMDPALGMAALNKKIARPWGSQPMPENWKLKAYQTKARSNGNGGGGGGGLGTWVMRLLFTAALVGGTFYTYQQERIAEGQLEEQEKAKKAKKLLKVVRKRRSVF